MFLAAKCPRASSGTYHPFGGFHQWHSHATELLPQISHVFRGFFLSWGSGLGSASAPNADFWGPIRPSCEARKEARRRACGGLGWD